MDLKAWDKALNPAAWSVASAGGAAQVTAPRPASLQTLLNKVVPLPANWTVSIPRATLALSGAKVLKALPYVGAAVSLFSIAQTMGLSDDGSIVTLGDCYVQGWNIGTLDEAKNSGCNPLVSAVDTSVAARNAANPTHTPMTSPYNYGAEEAGRILVFAAFATGGSGPCCYIWHYITNGSSVPATEQMIADRLIASAATEGQLADAVIRDSVAKNIDFGESGFMTPTTPVSVSVAPVSAPQETISTGTVPNPDGSTNTITKRATTTATPTVTGSTAGDTNISWETSTTETTTTTNNTTNVSTTTTTNNYDGTTTTKVETDLCKLHPNVSACLELGTVPTDIPSAVTSQPLNVTFTPPSSVAGTCPASYSKTLTGGKTIVFSFGPVCDFAGMMRPVVLAAAFLAAAFVVSGAVRADA